MAETEAPSLASTTTKSLPPPSAFLHTPDLIPYSTTPSIIHLKRDLLVPLSFDPPDSDPPAFVSSASEKDHRDGRVAASNANGILNTRFGDFPHSSIIGIPYGSQVRAAPSTHNTANRKRKRKDAAGEDISGSDSSGFLHVLAPTAELWTTSLPHRTQVVYTPDSSLVLHKLQVRPGSVVIEAGAGSGSFTHAAVRAVYRGYPDGREGLGGKADGKKGKVYSFEFHAERARRLREEIERHGLEGLVEIVQRDVCKDGFLLKRKMEGNGDSVDNEEDKMEDVSPQATAIFLDLPAPWFVLLPLQSHPPC